MANKVTQNPITTFSTEQKLYLKLWASFWDFKNNSCCIFPYLDSFLHGSFSLQVWFFVFRVTVLFIFYAFFNSRFHCIGFSTCSTVDSVARALQKLFSLLKEEFTVWWAKTLFKQQATSLHKPKVDDLTAAVATIVPSRLTTGFSPPFSSQLPFSSSSSSPLSSSSASSSTSFMAAVSDRVLPRSSSPRRSLPS